MEVGTGTTITFATGFFAEVVAMSWSGVSRPAIKSSHMGTTGFDTFEPGKLVDPGELEVTLHFAPGTAPPWGDAAESCTVTFPDAGAGTWAASAFMTEFAVDDIPLEDKIQATAKLKFSGPITVTP